jgi:menaquinone-dependent protoporphyrinogen oxidase
MKRVLIVYGTTEGQTEKIAQVLANTLVAEGLHTNVVRAGAGQATLQDYDGVIVAASVHIGSYQKPVTTWVRAHAHELRSRPTAFVSVSLGVLQKDNPKVVADLDAIVRGFCEATGWRPGTVTHVAGALLYTRYNVLTRWLMKRIAGKAGGDTDTSRDYEYTDWAQVRVIAEDFTRRLSSASGASDARRAS